MNYIACKTLFSHYFLYMTKKRGRKKKRGPKKKKPIVINKYVGLPRPYHIITTNNGIQLKDIYSAVSIDVALNKLRELQEKFNGILTIWVHNLSYEFQWLLNIIKFELY